MKRPGLMVSLLTALFLAVPVFAQSANDLTFTVQTSTSDGRSIVPKLTWSTTPAAASCTASGSSAWTGTKAAAGTSTLSAITATTSFNLACTWPGSSTATVTWTAPTTNTDATAYTDPGGFRLQWGTTNTEAGLTQSAYLQDPASRTWVSPPLAAGTWYFGVKAVNTSGIESAISNITPKTITAADTQTRTLKVSVVFPSPPTNVQ